jgi:hypothetical protein
MQKPMRFPVVLAVLTAAALGARRRTAEFAGAPYNRVQFEDLPPADVVALDLRGDEADFNSEQYVDAMNTRISRVLSG